MRSCAYACGCIDHPFAHAHSIQLSSHMCARMRSNYTQRDSSAAFHNCVKPLKPSFSRVRVRWSNLRGGRRPLSEISCGSPQHVIVPIRHCHFDAIRRMDKPPRQWWPKGYPCHWDVTSMTHWMHFSGKKSENNADPFLNFNTEMPLSKAFNLEPLTLDTGVTDRPPVLGCLQV